MCMKYIGHVKKEKKYKHNIFTAAIYADFYGFSVGKRDASGILATISRFAV